MRARGVVVRRRQSFSYLKEQAALLLENLGQRITSAPTPSEQRIFPRVLAQYV